MNKFFTSIIKGVYKVTQSIIKTFNIIRSGVPEIKESDIIEPIREEDKYQKVKDKVGRYFDFQVPKRDDIIGTHRNIKTKYEVVFEIELFDTETKFYETKYASLLTDRLKSVGGLKGDFIDYWGDYYDALNKKITKIKLDSVYTKIE